MNEALFSYGIYLTSIYFQRGNELLGCGVYMTRTLCYYYMDANENGVLFVYM